MTTEQRINRLERENRWMKFGGGGLLLMLLVALLSGATQDLSKPKVHEQVATRTLNLVDRQGRMRGYWGTARAGNPTMAMLDENGRTSILLGARKDGTLGLMFTVGGKDMPFWLSAGRDGRRGLYFLGGHEQGGMSLEFPGAKEPLRLRFHDRANTLRAELTVPKDGEVCLRRFTKDGVEQK